MVVYNGVGTPGIAGKAAQQLIRKGFRVVDSGNADKFDYKTTQVLLYHGTDADAQAVRDALGVGEIKVQSAPQELTDMIVIIGADYQPPAGELESRRTGEGDTRGPQTTERHRRARARRRPRRPRRRRPRTSSRCASGRCSW